MRFSRTISAAVTRALILTMVWVSLPHGMANAAMLSTDAAIDSAAGIDRIDDRGRVVAFLLREDVRARIAAHGVDPDEAVARVDSLTDAELVALAGRIDTLPAGQSGGISTTDATIILVCLILLFGFLIWGAIDTFNTIRGG